MTNWEVLQSIALISLWLYVMYDSVQILKLEKRLKYLESKYD